jgi:ribonuclease III
MMYIRSMDLTKNHICRETIRGLLKFGRNRPIFEPNDLFYYMRAFVHKSIIEETKKGPHMEYMTMSNEVPEFAGDSLYSAAVSLYLMNTYSHLEEGNLSKIRMRIVCSTQMTHVANLMGMRDCILVSNSVVNAYTNDSFAENCFEAFVYAVYMDQGFEGVCKFTYNVINTYISPDTFVRNNNYKDIFIQYTKVFDIVDLQFNYRQDEDRKFIVCVSMNGHTYDETGPHKKKIQAEQAASKRMLDLLNITEESINIRRQIKKADKLKSQMNV